MSKIDFSQMVTAEDKAAEAQAARAKAIKADCGRRILEVASERAQISIQSAVLTYTTILQRGGDQATAEAHSKLADADFPVVDAGFLWIARMKDECRRAITENDDPAWPTVPAGVIDLVARF